jgi:phage terminase large subunit GpA-like protein
MALESSPISARNSADEVGELRDDRPEVLLAFDGAGDLLRAWRDGLTSDPDLTVSAWADRHRILSPRGANEAGPWRTSRTPYLRELMDALSPRHPAQRVVFMKGSQLGASESGCCWIGYVIHHAPGPMLAVQPSV